MLHYEAGQILHNNPIALPMPEFAEALMFAIRREISRVYWNVNQKYWAQDANAPHPWDWEDGEELSYDTGISGLEWRPYYNWGGSPDDDDWDQDEANKPNFAFEGVEVRWYKNFGRSFNVNVDWLPEKWAAWFDRCLAVIRLHENRKDEITYEQAVEKGNAPRRCPECQKFYNWPAKQCAYDGAVLIKYILNAEEKDAQKIKVKEWLASIPHGTPGGYAIVESVELGNGWRCALAQGTKEPTSMFDVFSAESKGHWSLLLLGPDGCIHSSFGSDEETCRKAMPSYVEAWKWSDEDQIKKAREHVEYGPLGIGRFDDDD